MKLIKKALIGIMLFVFALPNICILNFTLASNSPYDNVLDNTINWESLDSAINHDVVENEKWSNLVNEQVKAIIWYAIDVFIVIGIALAFFGGYTIMTSNSEDKMKEWIRLIVFGILWIIIMMSARFLAEWLVWDRGLISTEFLKWEDPLWVNLAKNLYEKLLYPFIKVALYLVIWILFFMMAAKVITFVISTDEAAKKKAWWIIIWCVVGILIIMWSKQIVEAVMGSQDEVLNTAAKTFEWWRVDWMWAELTEFNNIQLISQVINWVMWLTMFVIVVLIIIQWYSMFTKPDDPKNRERLKKCMLYVIIWVLVIWASYVISNVLVLNWFTSPQW